MKQLTAQLASLQLPSPSVERAESYISALKAVVPEAQRVCQAACERCSTCTDGVELNALAAVIDKAMRSFILNLEVRFWLPYFMKVYSKNLPGILACVSAASIFRATFNPLEICLLQGQLRSLTDSLPQSAGSVDTEASTFLPLLSIAASLQTSTSETDSHLRESILNLGQLLEKSDGPAIEANIKLRRIQVSAWELSEVLQ